MFPSDAITTRISITGTGSVVLASSTRTVLGASFQKETTAKNLYLYCNSDIIAGLYSTVNVYFQPLQTLCNGTITFTTSGSGINNNSLLLTFVSRDIYTTSSATSTQPIVNGFSYGDILSNMLLIFILTLLFFKTLKEWLLGTKVDGASAIKIEKYHNL
jgi:hypothetical protein